MTLERLESPPRVLLAKIELGYQGREGESITVVGPKRGAVWQ